MLMLQAHRTFRRLHFPHMEIPRLRGAGQESSLRGVSLMGRSGTQGGSRGTRAGQFSSLDERSEAQQVRWAWSPSKSHSMSDNVEATAAGSNDVLAAAPGTWPVGP